MGAVKVVVAVQAFRRFCFVVKYFNCNRLLKNRFSIIAV
jgi:hypothetical protein